MNNLQLTGKFVRHKLFDSKAGKKYGFLTLETKSFGKTRFVEVKVFGDNASVTEGFLPGEIISVVGHLEQNSYERDGKKIYKQDAVADYLDKIGLSADAGYEPTIEESDNPF